MKTIVVARGKRDVMYRQTRKKVAHIFRRYALRLVFTLSPVNYECALLHEIHPESKKKYHVPAPPSPRRVICRRALIASLRPSAAVDRPLVFPSQRMIQHPSPVREARVKTKENPLQLIALLEAMGFLFVAAAIWFDELFDLAHYLFGAQRSNFNLDEAAFESAAVLIMGTIVVIVTRYLTQRIAQLEQLLSICTFCKKIRRPGTDPARQASWEPIEQYIEEKTGSQFSHGLCPDCLEKHYGHVLHQPSPIAPPRK